MWPEDALKQERQMVLATLVLTGVLTREQLNKLIDSGTVAPDNWEGIVDQVERFKAGETPDA